MLRLPGASSGYGVGGHLTLRLVWPFYPAPSRDVPAPVPPRPISSSGHLRSFTPPRCALPRDPTRRVPTAQQTRGFICRHRSIVAQGGPLCRQRPSTRLQHGDSKDVDRRTILVRAVLAVRVRPDGRGLHAAYI